MLLNFKESSISGHIRVFLYDLNGDEITTDIFTENNIVFEITSFFNRVKSETNIKAITDCIGYRISPDKLAYRPALCPPVV